MTASLCARYAVGMSTASTTRPRRRSVAAARRTRLTVTLTAEVAERLAELADRYGVTRGTIAADAIDRGLKATHEALRRAARSAARGAGK